MEFFLAPLMVARLPRARLLTEAHEAAVLQWLEVASTEGVSLLAQLRNVCDPGVPEALACRYPLNATFRTSRARPLRSRRRVF